MIDQTVHVHLCERTLDNPVKEAQENCWPRATVQCLPNLLVYGHAKLSVTEQDKIKLISFHSHGFTYVSYNKESEQTMKSVVLNLTLCHEKFFRLSISNIMRVGRLDPLFDS